MIVSSDLMKLLLAGMKTTFMKRLKETPVIHPAITTITNSTKDKETYPWLGEDPAVTEWLDERQEQAIAEHNFEITNRSWSNMISVDRDTIEDDAYSQIKLRASGLGKSFAQFYDESVFTLLAQGNLTTGTSGEFKGKNITCWDGGAFFASTHTIQHTGVDQSNVGSTALSYASLAAARVSMMKIKNDHGKPITVMPNLLVVPPDLYDTALKITGSAIDPSEGTTTSFTAKNTLSGIKVIQSPYLTDANNWFLFDTVNSITNPIIIQIRRKVQFNSLTDGTESAFLRKKLYFGSDARIGFGFADWRYAYGAFVT